MLIIPDDAPAVKIFDVWHYFGYGFGHAGSPIAQIQAETITKAVRICKERFPRLPCTLTEAESEAAQ